MIRRKRELMRTHLMTQTLTLPLIKNPLILIHLVTLMTLTTRIRNQRRVIRELIKITNIRRVVIRKRRR